MQREARGGERRGMEKDRERMSEGEKEKVSLPCVTDTVTVPNSKSLQQVFVIYK